MSRRSAGLHTLVDCSVRARAVNNTHPQSPRHTQRYHRRRHLPRTHTARVNSSPSLPAPSTYASSCLATSAMARRRCVNCSTRSCSCLNEARWLLLRLRRPSICAWHVLRVASTARRASDALEAATLWTALVTLRVCPRGGGGGGGGLGTKGVSQRVSRSHQAVFVTSEQSEPADAPPPPHQQVCRSW